MADPEHPIDLEDAVRAELAAMVAGGPAPDDDRLDALEHRVASPRPHRAWVTVAAVAMVVLLIGTAVVLGSRTDPEPVVTDTTHPCGVHEEPPVPLPSPYRREGTLVFPLSLDLGREGPTGSPIIEPGRQGATLRYPDGEVIRVTTAPGTPRDAAPSPFPTSAAEIDRTDPVRSITSGMTASGRVTSAEAPQPIGRSFLEDVARSSAELPATMADALSHGQPFPVIEQSFELGTSRFDRTIEFTDGIVHVSSDLTSPGEGGVRGDGRELSMMVGASQPHEVLQFSRDGRYRWIAFVPNGLQVRIDTDDGDGCRAAVGDQLTGGEYWLIEDANGDRKVHLEVTTKGRPTRMTLSEYAG